MSEQQTPTWASTVTWEPIPNFGGLGDDPQRVTHCADLVLGGKDYRAFRHVDGSYVVEESDPDDLREQLEGWDCSAGFSGGLGE